MINRVISVGRLTKQPELKKANNGKSVCTFTLGLDRRVPRDFEGQRADFPNYVAWGQSAEYLCQHGFKGALVSVEGRLTTRNYEYQGKKVFATEVVCESLNVLERKTYEEPSFANKEEKPAENAFVIDTDSLPFY